MIATIGRDTSGRVFYGWWVVLTSALALLIGSIPFIVFSVAVFLKPLARDFHTGRAAVSFAFSLHNFAVALSLPIAGRLVDRFGARKVILPAIAMNGLLLLSINWRANGIWQLYLFFLAAGVIESGAGPVPFADTISHWFDRQRGLALGAMMLGLGVGAVVMPPLAQRLIESFGWRFAYGTAGAAILLISLPVVARYLRERPESMGLSADGAFAATTPIRGGNDPGVSWSEACRSQVFWIVLCGTMPVSASLSAGSTHIAAILADRGGVAQTGALATSLLGFGLLVGRIGTGYLLDRFFAPRVAAAIFACAAAGIALLRMTNSAGFVFPAAFLIGLGLGAEVDVMGYLTSRYFGLRAFGVIYGVIFGAFAIGGGLGAYLMGAAFDATGSYALPLVLFSITALAGTGFMLLLGPYRYGPRALEPLLPISTTAGE